MSPYKRTAVFWDQVFQDIDTDFDHRESLSIKEIEEGLDWLVDDGCSMIDYGCGDGKLLLRCIAKGSKVGVGIDISPEGIKRAKELAKTNDVKDQIDLIEGGLETLSAFDEDEFDSGILSNIVDNLLPQDSIALLEEFNRVIKPGGKIFLKLNDHVDPSQLEEWEAKKVRDDLYKEESGLFFWNLKDEKVLDLLEKHFKIEKRVDVEFKEESQINRLYYLRNR